MQKQREKGPIDRILPIKQPAHLCSEKYIQLFLIGLYNVYSAAHFRNLAQIEAQGVFLRGVLMAGGKSKMSAPLALEMSHTTPWHCSPINATAPYVRNKSSKREIYVTKVINS